MIFPKMYVIFDYGYIYYGPVYWKMIFCCPHRRVIRNIEPTKSPSIEQRILSSQVGDNPAKNLL